jgi:predicted ester cyclase
MATGATPAPEQHPGAASLLQRWFNEIWNGGRLETVDEILAENAVMWGVGRPDQSSRGSADFKEFYRRQTSACSNIRIVLDQIVEQGDTALARWTVTFDHTGDGLGIPATNKTVSFVGMSGCRARGGKVVESWNIWDQPSMARQLGLLEGRTAEFFA